MRRRLSTAALVVCVIAWAAAGAVWVRGLYRADLVGVVLPGHLYVEAIGWSGCVRTTVVRRWPMRPTAWWSSGVADPYDDHFDPTEDTLVGPDAMRPDVTPPHTALLRWHGFEWETSRVLFFTDSLGQVDVNVPRRMNSMHDDQEPTTAPLRVVSVTVPRWFPTVAVGSVAVPWAALTAGRARRTRRRRIAGLCVRCGYDLRQTPARCPECGAVVIDLPNPQRTIDNLSR